MAKSSSADLATRMALNTRCPICLEQFNKPKLLPCHHTYCLECLTDLYKDSKIGDEVPCPECRREFDIPAGGVEGLPNDFKMQSWLEMMRELQLRGDERSEIARGIRASRWSCIAVSAKRISA